MAYYGGYNSGTGKRPMTKEQLKAKQKRDAVKNRRRSLVERHNAAVYNARELGALRSGAVDPMEYGDGVPAIDTRFTSDIQNAKFCRKPVGFLMSLLFLVAIALVALSFIPLDIPVLAQFTAIYQEAEPVVNEDNEKEGEGDEAAAEAAPMLLMERAANADEQEGEGEEGDGEEDAPAATYYNFRDPVYGWISYIAGLVNFDVSLGESPWYDAQISKVETGMEDTIAPILIRVFPAAVILYAIFALVLFIKTFICWASGDRRIFRHTWIECLIMILMALIVALGGFASTVEVTGTMDFGGIVDYLMGAITGTGGFTVGYGMFIMLGLPLVGMLLSFFLLTRKLRSRDIMQPVIMYNYARH